MEKLELSKTRRIMNVIDWVRELPHHIAQLIFSKLPISNLPACRIVCKIWNDVILDYASSSKFLTNTFLLCNHSNPRMHCINIDIAQDLKSDDVVSLPFDGNSYVVLSGSCNGLLVISKIYKCTIHRDPDCDFQLYCDGIFNPMTNEFIQVSQPELDENIHDCNEVTDVLGLGFSPTTKQYKLFRAVDNIMEVLTFGRSETNPNHHQRWRFLHHLTFEAIQHGVYLDGVIYWIGIEEDKENECVIYALDVETEKIELSIVFEVSFASIFIHQVNGILYVTFFNSTISIIEVWRMQEKDSWIEEFVIHPPNHWLIPGNNFLRCTVVKAFEDGEILCMIYPDLFCLYNPNTGKDKIIKQNGNIYLHICEIKSLNFGSLSDILAGDEEQMNR